MNVSKISGFNFQPVPFRGQISRDKPAFRGAPAVDTINLSPRFENILSLAEAEKAAIQLKLATSGYRDSTGRTFDDKLVNTMTAAVATYGKEHGQKAFMVGGDTRWASKIYGPMIADRLADQGFDVYIPQLKDTKSNKISDIPSPLLALATKAYKVPLSILLTASHNPWEDGGYCFLADGGCIATEVITTPIADNLVEVAKKGSFDAPAAKRGKLIPFDPYGLYKQFIDMKKFIDFEKIKEAQIDTYYEGLGGTGSNYFPQLMIDNGVPLGGVLDTITSRPEPEQKTLKNLAAKVTGSTAKLKIGLATDGDADRFGIVDENGKYISSDDVITLAAYHNIKNKGMTKGTIIKNHATTEQIEKLADYFNAKGMDIDVATTPIGFKFLGKKMLELENTDKPAIITGEASGGFTVRDHVPSKDGFVAILTILELVAFENRPISEILKTVKDEIGADYKTKCTNMAFPDDSAKDATENALRAYLDSTENTLAGYEIDFEKTHAIDKSMREQKEGGDGVKICLKNGSSAIVRKSGTEPVVRLIVDATDEETFIKLKKFLNELAESRGGKEVEL